MGAWGFAAWDNDGAADWYGEVFDATGLARLVEETLSLDVEESHEEIRAAAYLLVVLGRVYVWPIAQLDKHLRLAVQRLEEIKNLDVYQDSPEFVEAIDDELQVLQARLTRETDGPTP